jgi:hypothetical protein
MLLSVQVLVLVTPQYPVPAWTRTSMFDQGAI